MKKVLFFIVLFLLLSFKVSAENVTLVREKFDNIYVYYYDSSVGRTRYLEGEKYIFGDKVGYCLEIGKKIYSNVYQLTTSFDDIDISDSDLEYIKLVSYYGYDYPGHNTDRYYMATQELIWVRLIRTSIKWTIDFNPDVFLNLSNEKNEIYNLIRKHYIKPSFEEEDIDVVLGEENVIEDTNNVLSMYESITKNVVIEENRLIIKKDFNEDEIVLERKGGTKQDFLLYTSGNSQKMMASGNVDNLPCKIKVNLIGGSLKIKKLDKESGTDIPKGDATLNGAVYELFDINDNIIDTLIIGSKESIDNLPLGKYYLKEKKASNGYLLDDNVYEIEITKDNLDLELTVYEEVIKRKVELFKVLASDTTGILVSEAGVIFEIYDKNNILVESIVTDNDGYASIILPYGKYTFKQVSSTENYYKVDDFEVVIDTNDEKPIYKLLSNSEIKAKVKVIKKDLDTLENVLFGKVKFKIFDVNKNEFISFKISYPEVKVISEFEINDEGYFITPFELNSGKYILYEIDEMMDGYLYNKEGVNFEIGDNANLINEEGDIIIEVPFYNKRVKGSILINKYGENIIYKDNSYYYEKIKLENVYFNVYAQEDIYENGKLVIAKDGYVGQIITDNNGKGVIDNLPLGKYYFKEIKSNNNNVVGEEVYNIELKYKDQYTDNIEYEIDVDNYLDKGKVIINKYESNSNIGIANTLIEVHNDNDEIVYKGYTDKKGQIILDDLMYGQYYLSEVEASSGYRLLEDKIYFDLDKEEISINIYNDRIIVPNTGIDIGIYKILVMISILIWIFLIIYFWENKKVVVVSIGLIILSVLYLGSYVFMYLSDRYKNEMAIEVFLGNKDFSKYDMKYKYTSLLDIPSIDLKRGVLDINDKYNNVKYNIELIREDNNAIILAAHNGNSYNSYFDDLYKMELGDYINYYHNGKVYKYIYSESYEVKKNGYVDIYKDNGKKAIILITCKKNSNDAQTLYIGYLIEESTYNSG